MRVRRFRLRAVSALLGGGLALLFAGAAFAQRAPEPTPTPPSRGELLYANHCIACHTQQMHWRDKRLVTDWATLNAQVALWQERGTLGWTGDDIQAVAAFLNDSVYRFPREDRALAALPFLFRRPG